MDDILGDFRRDSVHAGSGIGDFIYPREESCYEDPLRDYKTRKTQALLPATYLMALCIMKMRLVAAYNARRNGMEILRETNVGRVLGGEILSTVEDYLVGNCQLIERMRQQVDAYLECIHANNPIVLPALLNPGPIIDQGQPTFHEGALTWIEEAWMVLQACIICCPFRVPGFKQMMVDRFGPNPVYNTRGDLVNGERFSNIELGVPDSLFG
jgi:hypothetical protein